MKFGLRYLWRNYWGMDQRSSSTVHETLCTALVPLIRSVEAFVFSLAGCFEYRRPHKKIFDVVRLATDSPFNVNEIEALRELFNSLSSSLSDDGLMHKEELRLALLKTQAGENLFLDRVFELFDEKRNGVVDFEEFVHALSVFHPCAPLEKKIDFAFRLYDLKQNGYIDREEVRQMVVASVSETGMQLADEVIETIIDKTFQDVDADSDGKISKEEWQAFVIRQPAVLKHMTLPRLEEITTVFTGFIFDTEVDDSIWKRTGTHK